MDLEVLCTWIEGYEGLYHITNDGKIFSHYINAYLSPVKDSHGYLQVGLTKDKIRTRFLDRALDKLLEEK